MDVFCRVIASLVAVAFLALAGVSLKWGLGHARLEPWMIEVSRAAKEGRWLDVAIISPGRFQIEAALNWHDRADGHELLAHYSLAAARAANGSRDELRRARDEFEAALRLRPTMPYTWAYLASTKYRLGELDSRFYQALVQAQRLGPWEPTVQEIVADFGLAIVDEAPTEVRQAVLANVQRGLVHQGGQMMFLAQKRGKLQQVCRLELPEKHRMFCVK